MELSALGVEHEHPVGALVTAGL